MTEKKIFFFSRGSFNPVRDPTKSLGCPGESTDVKGILKFFLEGFPKSLLLRPKVHGVLEETCGKVENLQK